MVPTTRGLIICVFSLLSLGETVFSQRGHCVGNNCFAFFSEPRNFSSALSRCRASGGHFFKFNLTNEALLVGLVGPHSGGFWLEVASSGEEKEETLSQNCSSIFVSMCRNLGVKQRPCRETLDGYLCEYTITKPCKSLQTGSGVHVTYNNTLLRFEIHDSETVPQGTFAVAEKVGGKFPDSRHVCLDGSWIRAPWLCEAEKGGCDHNCSRTSNTCICPAGQSLHSNNISCIADPCAHCAHECSRDGDTPVCTCWDGFRLAPDQRTCEEVLEHSEEMNACTDENSEWDGSRCVCRDYFYDEDGVCVDFSICPKCEYKCKPDGGVARCVCQKGFRVSARDSTKCEQHCTERQCLPHCVFSDDKTEPDCSCPAGYILDTRNGTANCTDMDECDSRPCDHNCLNTLGSYSCLCEPGFKLQTGGECVRDEEEEEDSASGEAPSVPTPEAHPASGQSLIKTGSVLCVAGIVVLFAALLLCFLVRHLLKRCGKFQLSSLKHHDIDIFYLQQMTMGTYQRFSSDRPLKNPDQEVI